MKRTKNTYIKEKDNSLNESEALYLGILNASPDGIAITDLEGRIIIVSPSALKVVGCDLEQKLLKRFIYEFIQQNDRERALLNIGLMHQGIMTGPAEYRGLRFDDSTFDMEVNADFVRDNSGKSIGMIFIIRDITERKRAEETQMENERIFKESQEVAHLGSYVWNISTGFWKSSKIMDEIFGIDDNYVRSFDGWLDLIHPDWRETMESYVKNEVIGKNQRFDKEYKIIRKENGQELWVYGVGRLESDINNKPSKLIGTISDITYRKKTEDEIQRLTEELEHRVILRTRQLEAANKELEAFSYSVSHDLRAPVRHILGFSEILKNECSDQLSDEAKHYLDTISGSAKKMGVLIDDLLRFSRTGRSEITKSSFKMNQVVEDALMQIKHTIEGRQVDLQISNLPDVSGDYNLLRQVWVNLFNNAIKYTSTRDISTINVGYKDEPNEVVFFIYDNGVGFDMRFAHKLFGVFQRLHSSTQFDGTGIGLANVRRIISRHGGRTWADAEVDKGATFFFSLPKNAPAIMSNK
jgi:PAS domain S-box-containing protein